MEVGLTGRTGLYVLKFADPDIKLGIVPATILFRHSVDFFASDYPVMIMMIMIWKYYISASQKVGRQPLLGRQTMIYP